jgi:tetratricopeptide (TPR) repeat protein
VEEKPKYKFLSPEPLKKRLFKTKWFISLVVVLIVALVGVYVGWVVVSNKDLSEFFNLTTPSSETTQKISSKTLESLRSAEASSDSGDIESAVAAYDQAISEVSDNYNKSLMILSKANVYYNDGDFAQALVVAKEAEAIDVNYNVTVFLAQTHEQLYELAQALDYYQRALSLVNINDRMAEGTTAYVQGQIDNLISMRDELYDGDFANIAIYDALDEEGEPTDE